MSGVNSSYKSPNINDDLALINVVLLNLSNFFSFSKSAPSPSTASLANEYANATLLQSLRVNSISPYLLSGCNDAPYAAPLPLTIENNGPSDDEKYLLINLLVINTLEHGELNGSDYEMDYYYYY